MTTNHGISTKQVPTSILPPRKTYAGLPVVFGTAEKGPINKPVLISSYKEAVEIFGYSDEWNKYTLCEFCYSQFVLFGVAPAVFINVFDPAKHKTTIENEAKTFENGVITLNNVPQNQPVLSENGTVYTEDADYLIDIITGEITRLETGEIAEGASVEISYEGADPLKVSGLDIIGGIDETTNARTGLELIEEIYPRFREVPGLILSPGFSQDIGVCAVMKAKTQKINGIFNCMAIADLPIAGADAIKKYSDCGAYKNEKNLISKNLILCWPKVSLGNGETKKEFHLSTQVAGLINQVDANNDGVPFESPSNKQLQIDACYTEAGEVFLSQIEANILNAQGIITALNFANGFTAWGNYTSVYPNSTDVKDAFVSVQRMFIYEENQFILTYFIKVDGPLNRRLITTIVESENIKLNGWRRAEYILSGKIVILEDENPLTDVMSGKIKYHIYLTPPSPAQEIVAACEYDPAKVGDLIASVASKA